MTRAQPKIRHPPPSLLGGCSPPPPQLPSPRDSQSPPMLSLDLRGTAAESSPRRTVSVHESLHTSHGGTGNAAEGLEAESKAVWQLLLSKPEARDADEMQTRCRRDADETQPPRPLPFRFSSFARVGVYAECGLASPPPPQPHAATGHVCPARLVCSVGGRRSRGGEESMAAAALSDLPATSRRRLALGRR